MADIYIITQGENKHPTAYRISTVLRERLRVFHRDTVELPVLVTAAKYVEVPLDVATQAELKGEAVVLWIESTRGVAALPGFEKYAETFV